MREGLNALQFKVPGRMVGKPKSGKGPLGEITVDEETLDTDYLTAMSWDLKTAKRGTSCWNSGWKTWQRRSGLEVKREHPKHSGLHPDRQALKEENMELGLKDKIALVTGAGSQIGFGKVICLALAKEGCDIIASDIDFEGAKKTAAEVEALGRKALAVKADITKKAENQEMVKQALTKFGKIDILVNNAGAMLGGGPFLDQDEALWDREFALNHKGCMLVSQAVLPA